MHEGEWKLAWAEGFLGQAQQDDGILAAGKQQRRVGRFGRHFAHDVDGFRFKAVEVTLVQNIAHMGAFLFC
ncbi:hypothetical protein D3C85_383940 [compost metagenome]